MSLLHLLSIAGVGMVAMWGYRDLRVLFVAQVAALVANLFLPFEPFGVVVTSQKLVAVAAAVVCGLLFVRGRISLPWPTPGQVAFTVTYGVIMVLHIGHELGSSVAPSLSGLFSAFLNIILFHLAVVILHNLGQEQRRGLFTEWLPWAVSAVLAVVVASWVQDMLARPDLDMSRFHQGYRLRSSEEHNIVNVWAATLVLVIPFVWQPLFGGERLRRRIAGLSAVGVTGLAIALTFSRAAFLGLVALLVGGFVLDLVGRIGPTSLGGRRARGRLLLWGLGAATALAVVTAAFQVAGLPVVEWVVGRVMPLLTGTDPSLHGRLYRYEVSWDLLRSLPMFGYGPAANEIELLPENTLILVSLHYGLLGLASFLGMLGLIGWEVGRWWWRRRSRVGAAAWAASYLTYILLLLTNDFLFFSTGTILLATITVVVTPEAEHR